MTERAGGRPNLPATIGDLLRLPDLGARLASIAPPGFDGKRLARELAATLRENPPLRGVTVDSLLIAVSRVASLGLSLAPASAEAYLIPRRDKDTGNQKASLMIGRNGWVRLAHLAANVVDVVAHTVHERDSFRLKLGGGFHVEHEPYIGDDPGPIVCAYAIAMFASGATRGAYLSKAEIAQARAAADKDSKAWTNWPDMMVQKVIAKRLARIVAAGHPLVTAALAVDDHVDTPDLPILELSDLPTPRPPAPMLAAPTFDELKRRITAVASIDDADAALDVVSRWSDAAERRELEILLRARRGELESAAA